LPEAKTDAIAYYTPMPTTHDRAVVIARLDYSETSQIIVFFTRDHGKVRAIAKGIKRGTKTRFATGADLLDLGEIVTTAREERAAGLATLTEWKQMRGFSGLREKLPRIYAGQYAAEITAHLTEDWDPHQALFDALVTLLETLNDADEPLPPIVAYQITLLNEIGSLPRFDACVLCGRTGDLTHFSSFEGGMICRHCEPGRVEKREIAFQTLRLLQRRINGEPEGIGNAGPSASTGHAALESSSARASSYVHPFDVLDYHIAHLMGREPALAAKLVPRQARRKLE
jgi:DNA repair protein RecO (recombination protein O)